MTFRSLVARAAATVATVAALALPAATANAQPITYRFTGLVEGDLGPFSFATPTAFTLDFSGDASDAMQLGPGSSTFINSNVTASATLGMLFSGPLPGMIPFFVFVDQGAELGAPVVGFGVATQPVFALFNGTLATYDLSTLFGPVSGQVETLAGGAISVTNGTFEAISGVSSVPEPSTYALMATGLVTLAGVAARRRRVATA